jgi:hypothetical protein
VSCDNDDNVRLELLLCMHREYNLSMYLLAVWFMTCYSFFPSMLFMWQLLAKALHRAWNGRVVTLESICLLRSRLDSYPSSGIQYPIHTHIRILKFRYLILKMMKEMLK